MPDVIVFWTAFLGAVVISAVCSLFEAVLYSVPQAHIQKLAESGRPSGRLLRRLREDVQRPIAAILILNTIANSAGAVIAGAAWVKWRGDTHEGLFAAAFTFCVLTFSEIIPKTVGVVFARRLAPVVAYPLQLLVWAMSPLVWVASLLTSAIARRRPRGPHAREIEALATLALRYGRINPLEEEVIGNVLALDEKTVRDVMTPRTVVFSVPEDAPLSRTRELSADWPHSRVPIYRGDREEVVGFVFAKDVFRALAEDRHDMTFGELRREIHFVPESLRLDTALNRFLTRREHLFAVRDEYGGFEGIVTLEDVIEEIVGREIVDESDRAVDMQELARRRSQARARSAEPPAAEKDAGTVPGPRPAADS